MICFPNAKINLGLLVKSKRKDGFHNIESVLVPIPFCDVLEFKPAKEFCIKTYGVPIGIESKDNILFKTWKTLAEEFQIPPLEIHLLKTIPSQSGLGGGSSDAAFLIKEVNNYFNLKLEIEKMQHLALSIGSDCPFFIENKPAIVTGKGEFSKKLNLSLNGLHLVLLKPTFGISTKEAYAMVKPTPSGSILDTVSQPVESWKGNLKNDFEEPLFHKYPKLKRMKENLYKSGAVYASITGSGSSIFGVFSKRLPLCEEIKKLVCWSGTIEF
jgi:4-diphosphocytidyl-2-C-methyl-D-erythritol kinase